MISLPDSGTIKQNDHSTSVEESDRVRRNQWVSEEGFFLSRSYAEESVNGHHSVINLSFIFIHPLSKSLRIQINLRKPVRF